MRSLQNASIVLFLTVQIGLPLRGLIQDKFEDRGNFSWNMYSQRYRCSVAYRLVEASGAARELDWSGYFRRRDKALHVLHGDRLPAFHAFLCRVARSDETQQIRGDVACLLNAAPERVLVSPHRDLCPPEGPGTGP